MSKLSTVLCVTLLVANASAHGQDRATAASVKRALLEDINQLQMSLPSATSDIQRLGQSLGTSVDALVGEIDRVLGSKITFPIDRLDGHEVTLVRDAAALTLQIRKATAEVRAKEMDTARLDIVESDVAAYNALHSLPCRDTKPRILASFPSRLTSGVSTPVLTLRGNFLMQGNPRVSVNGNSTTIVQRSDTQISLAVPAAVMDSAINDEVELLPTIEGLEQVERTDWPLGLLGCREAKKRLSQSPVVSSILEPPVTYSIAGFVRLTYTGFREVTEPAQTVANTGSDRCDDLDRVDRTWCISGPGTLSKANVVVISANCNSGYEGHVANGDRCVQVRGKVGGCGAIRAPAPFGNAWLSCKGRGWLSYTIQLTRREPFEGETAQQTVGIVGAPGMKSFSVALPPATGLDNPMSSYSLVVTARQGRKIVDTYALTHLSPDAGAATSRVNNGTIAIDIVC